MEEAFASARLPWIYRKAVGFLNYLQVLVALLGMHAMPPPPHVPVHSKLYFLSTKFQNAVSRGLCALNREQGGMKGRELKYSIAYESLPVTTASKHQSVLSSSPSCNCQCAQLADGVELRVSRLSRKRSIRWPARWKFQSLLEGVISPHSNVEDERACTLG